MALRQHRSVPNEFVNTISRSTSGSDSARFSRDARYPFAPALLIQMSTPPMLSDAKSVNASTRAVQVPDEVGGELATRSRHSIRAARRPPRARGSRRET